MSYPCSESTVLVNTTHKMLSELQLANPNLVATMPTPRVENVFGYDTAFESWKLFLCQYKRPYCDNGRFHYYLDITQNIKLHFWAQIFLSPCTFFPLVLTKSDQHLAKINSRLLDNVIFVDVMNVWPISTQLRVDSTLDGQFSVEYKVRKGPWVSVNFYKWNQIALGIRSCDVGGKMKLRNEITESNRLLREIVYSLDENKLPSWWHSRAEKLIIERFEERSAVQFSEALQKMLSWNIQRERPTTIVSRSFRAFVYPMNT